MNSVDVSIIVPCFNQGEFLIDSLNSVKNQFYQNWECIIVDDGSTEPTESIVKPFCDDDERFIYFKKENGGLSNARNFGIQKSRGKFILPLDADDKISKEYIVNAVNLLEENNNVKLVYCDAIKFGSVEEFWVLPEFSLNLLAQKNMIFCSGLYRKEDWEKVGGYDEMMKYALEDWEFWISILKNGGEVKKLNHIGFFYRTKKNSMISNLTTKKRIEMTTYLSKKHTDFFIKYLGDFIFLNDKISYLEKNPTVSFNIALTTIRDRFFKFFFSGK